jgi:hypothetical protein
VKSVEWLLWYSQAISSGRLEATAQLCGEYPANQSPDSAKTIWTYQDETLRRADGLSCRREHHSSGKGSQRSESPASQTFFDAYTSVLTESGNLAHAAN